MGHKVEWKVKWRDTQDRPDGKPPRHAPVRLHARRPIQRHDFTTDTFGFFRPNRTGLDSPADLPPRPDTLYGVSKAFGEALARYYVDRYGFEVACLRIGTFTETPDHVRTLSTWLSPGDAARLVDAALRAPDLGYAVVWGISNNTRRTWSLEAGFALGYRPQDDAEDFASSVDLTATDPSDAFVGGGFTSSGFGITEVEQWWSTSNG